MTLISSPWTEISLETAPLKIIDGDRGTNYPKQTDFFDSGYCLFLNTGNVTSSGFNFSNCNFISQEKDAALRKGRLQKYDVVLTTRGTVGNTAWVNEAVPYPVMRINSGMVILRPDTEKILPDYIYFFFRSPKFQDQVNALRSGSAQPQLPIQVLKNIKLPLPPIAEQRRIAEILDRADAVRRKRQEAIALTEELLRSAFLEMFGDPVANSKGWKVCQLDQFSDIQSGIAKGKKIDPSKAISVPYMRVANVQDGYLDLSEIKEIQILPIDLSRYSLKQGDLLLTEGGDPDKLGRGAVWYGEVQPCIHQNHIFCVRPDKSVADPEYLSTLIGSNHGKRYFLKAAKQTTGIATINKTQLRNFPALLPPLTLQQKYNQLVLSIRSMRKNVEDVNGQTDNLFNSLLQRAFRGEL
ncbi:restriction endonuclease subunit S [Leptolyngbya sp. FACHB-321]|uniref:restriction endonuclease subunit S n=1 Tax=Leptolyngbya sp. FACHB-321 TaxID=2692807 RepID=UPI001687D3F1|nr:restriction endonuclease subunit S [Leptolyngbya sp. FACHB-321]MBD2034550.1 restriction endonuclease subunit S [Leptolyngbya sp. FACHB-321]